LNQVAFKTELRAISAGADQAMAQKYIENLRKHEYSDIESAVDPCIADQLPESTLDKMAAVIPNGSPTSMKLVGANRFSSNPVGTELNLSYEYQFNDRFLLANVAALASAPRGGQSTMPIQGVIRNSSAPILAGAVRTSNKWRAECSRRGRLGSPTKQAGQFITANPAHHVIVCRGVSRD
jgi:hypothetical protein